MSVRMESEELRMMSATARRTSALAAELGRCQQCVQREHPQALGELQDVGRLRRQLPVELGVVVQTGSEQAVQEVVDRVARGTDPPQRTVGERLLCRPPAGCEFGAAGHFRRQRGVHERCVVREPCAARESRRAARRMRPSRVCAPISRVAAEFALQRSQLARTPPLRSRSTGSSASAAPTGNRRRRARPSPSPNRARRSWRG